MCRQILDELEILLEIQLAEDLGRQCGVVASAPLSN